MAIEEGSGDGPDRPADLPDITCFVIDDARRVVAWSGHAKDMFGWTSAEVVGQPVSRVILTPDFPDRETNRTVIATGQHRDGRALRVAVHVARMESPSRQDLLIVSAIDLDIAPWWAVSQSVLRRFLENLPFGVAVLGTDLRYMWLNRPLEDMAGVPMEERLGRRVAEVLPDLDPEAMEGQLRRILQSGGLVRGFEYRGYTPADPEREHVYATSFFRLDDDAGRVLGAGYMGTDVTDRQRAQERLSLLTDSAASIGSSLDVARTTDELAATAVPRLADLVVVDLFERIMSGDEPGSVPEMDIASLVRVAQRSLRPGCPEAVVEIGQASNYGRESPAVRCLLDRQPLLEPDVESLTPSSTDDVVRAEHARKYGFRSLMAVPIAARGLFLGVAMFLRGPKRERFEAADLRLAEEFVARAAIAVDNARRYTRERTASLTLQRSLLPRASVNQASLEVAARYRPADSPGGVGGDWFDVIPLSAGRCALVVGDVVGRGIAAAAAMGQLRMAVRTLAAMDPGPEELLAHLDDLVLRLIDEAESEAATAGRSAGLTVLGATCLYAVYDPVTGSLTAARAGHPAPILVTADGAAVAELPPGPPLGLGSMPFEAATLDLAECRLIAMFTNGVLGAWASDPSAGLDRLQAELEHTEGRSLEGLCDRILENLRVQESVDDVALVLARPQLLGPDHVGSWDLPSDPAVVKSARTLVSSALAQWGLEEYAFTAELIVSELVTNAIRYGSPQIRLKLIRHSEVTCEVFDGSATSPRLRHARTTDEGGRGLFLVAQTAERWGTRYVPDGKVVWADLPLNAL